MEENVEVRPIPITVKEVIDVHSEDALEIPGNLIPEAVNDLS